MRAQARVHGPHTQRTNSTLPESEEAAYRALFDHRGFKRIITLDYFGSSFPRQSADNLVVFLTRHDFSS